MTNYTSSDSKSICITSTSKLIEFFEIFDGDQLSLDQIEEISKGILDNIIGNVVIINCRQGSDDLNQVQIETKDEGIFTLTSNQDVALNPNIFDLLGNTYLINRPREIWISNLSSFREKLQEALKYGLRVACVYSRVSGQIVRLVIISRPDPAMHDDYSSNSYIQPLSSSGGPGTYTKKKKNPFS